MKWETKLPPAVMVHGRQLAVHRRCRGKRVLHLGCVDTGLLEERFERGELMHQKLAAVASDLWGVDVNAEGIEFLRSHGFQQLVTADATGPIPQLEGRYFDIIVATEVIEHLLNPGLFLDSVRSWMAPGKTELIVTVPNAFRIDTLLSLFRRVERVHPDHNFWFSYKTASNLLAKAGLQIAEVEMYSLQPFGLLPNVLRRGGRGAVSQEEQGGSAVSPPFSRRVWEYFRTLPLRLLTTVLYAITPFWGDGLIFVARVPE